MVHRSTPYHTVIFTGACKGEKAHSRPFEWLRMAANGSECLRMAANGSECLRMAPNGCEWLRMAANGCEWLRMVPNVSQ